MQDKPFIFKEYVLTKTSRGNILQRTIPYIIPSYDLREQYLILRANVGCNNLINNSSTERIIDLESLRDIYIMLCRKIENFQNINKMLKRDGKGMYTLSDFIRGRIGEIYSEMGVMKILKDLFPKLQQYSLEFYNVSIVEQVMSEDHILQKKINAMNHSNYLLYQKTSKEILIRGEFDFAFQINYRYKKKEVSVLVVGESKTGNLYINKDSLISNFVSFYNFPYDYIIYAVVIPQEVYYNTKRNKSGLISESIKGLYKTLVVKAPVKYRHRGFGEKIYIMPFIFKTESVKTSSFFKHLSNVLTEEILRLFRDNNIEVMIKVGMYNNQYEDPRKYKPQFMVKVPSKTLREDARKLSEKSFFKKYGYNVYVPVTEE